jgi:hypothetical protein
MQTCLDGGVTCEHLANQVADAGPGAGRSREQLCLDTLTCILNTTTDCYNPGGPEECYCGSRATQACQDAGPDPAAPCRPVEENGLETTNSTLALTRLTDPSFGAGTANALLLCLGNCVDCLP